MRHFCSLRNSLQHTGIGKVFLDMENMLVLADDDGIFGSSMSDSTRAMVTENAEDIPVVIYSIKKPSLKQRMMVYKIS